MRCGDVKLVVRQLRLDLIRVRVVLDSLLILRVAECFVSLPQKVSILISINYELKLAY